MEITRQQLEIAKKVAEQEFQRLRELNPHEHPSHAAASALKHADKQCNLESYGEEGVCEANGDTPVSFQYLNMGDTYVLTLLFSEGEFMVTSWGDFVEKFENEHNQD